MKSIVPAFGQRLMRRRFAGLHPLHVALTVGDDWSAFAKEPFVDDWAYLALRPRDVRRPEQIDFRCVAGAAVTVFDQVRAAGEIEAPVGNPHEASRAPFFDLLREIAAWSGPLEFVTAAEIYANPISKPPYRVTAWRYAHDCKLADPARAWPWWWSESLDKKHGQKISAWCAAARSRGSAAAGTRRAA